MVTKVSALLNELRERTNGKTVILGVGNTLKQDDGVGPRLADRLHDRISMPVINCGEAPENYTSTIRRKEPNTIVIIDAVDCKAKPGTVKLISPANVKNETFSTHGVSLRAFADFIKAETSAETLILAVQPASVSFGGELSEHVEKAICALEKGFLEVFGKDAS